MAESLAKTFFPKLYSKLEKRRQAVRDEPLAMADITTLLTMHFNNKPLYQSIDEFYSDEFRQGLEKGIAIAELEKLPRYRKPTDEEVNLLFCDIHSREEKANYEGTNQPGS